MKNVLARLLNLDVTLNLLKLFIVIFYGHLFGNNMSSSIGALNGIEFLLGRLHSSSKNSRLTRLKD